MIRCHTRVRLGWIALAAAALAMQIAGEARQAGQPAPQSAAFFEASVRPILAANCYDCHADQKMGGLQLDSREGLLKGGRSGPAIVPGDPEKSLLIQAVRQSGAENAEGRPSSSRGNRGAGLVGEGGSGVAFSRGRNDCRRRAAWCTRRADDAPAAPAYVITPEHARVLVVSADPHAAGAGRVAPGLGEPIDRFVLARLEKEGSRRFAPRTSAR